MLKEHTSISDEDDDYDSTAPLDIHKARNRLYALDNAREDNRDIISMAPEKKRRKAEKIIMKPILAEAAAIQSRIHDAAVALTNANSSSATNSSATAAKTESKAEFVKGTTAKAQAAAAAVTAAAAATTTTTSTEYTSATLQCLQSRFGRVHQALLKM